MFSGWLSGVYSIVTDRWFSRIVHNLLSQEGSGYWLRTWWHTILADHGRYSCYAIFLALPSDAEAIRYMTDFGRELDLISGETCLVIALGKTEIRRSGIDEEVWSVGVQEQVSEGHSVKIAQLFGIGFEEFPCLVIFRDIRSPEHVVVTLRRMTAEEIAGRMRSLFSIIQRAVADNKDPLATLESHRNQQSLRRRGQTIVSGLRSFAGKTLETAMEAWIKANVA